MAPAPSSTLEKLSELPEAFEGGGGVTAGNSCPLNDGAAAVLVMSEDRAKELGLKPRARIGTAATHGNEPEYMGVAPDRRDQEGARPRRHEVSKDVDVVELNEAFAAQVIPIMAECDIPLEKLNTHGGAIALGPPVRHDRRPDHGHPAQRRWRPTTTGRPRDDVRRRRAGRGDAGRAPELTAMRSRQASARMRSGESGRRRLFGLVTLCMLLPVAVVSEATVALAVGGDDVAEVAKAKGGKVIASPRFDVPEHILGAPAACWLADSHLHDHRQAGHAWLLHLGVIERPEGQVLGGGAEGVRRESDDRCLRALTP